MVRKRYCNQSGKKVNYHRYDWDYNKKSYVCIDCDDICEEDTTKKKYNGDVFL